MGRFRLLLGVVLLAVVAGEVGADGPREVQTQVTRVALFKNGLGFFVRSGPLPGPGTVRIGPVPAGMQGSLWISYDPGTRFDNLATREETVTETAPAATLADLLRANVGKRVRLVFSAGANTETEEGVLEACAAPPKPPDYNPYQAGGPPAPTPGYGGYNPGYELLTVRTKDGLVAAPANQVLRASFLETPSTQSSREVKRVVLEGNAVTVAPGTGVTLSYLTKGITWVPSYVVDISKPKEATLTAKAEIIDEVEDLNNTHVDLVTGFPNLQFANIYDPLGHKEDLLGFIQALQRGYSPMPVQPGGYNGYGGGGYGAAALAGTAVVMGQIATGPAGPDFGTFRGNPAPSPNYGSGAGGVSNEDLFLYPLVGVTLQRGEVGYYALFTQKVAYEDLYTWDIPDYSDLYSHYYNNNGQTQQKPEPVVWHSLKLTNASQTPWTTAPAETMKAGMVLGQDTLAYTAAGGEGKLRITQAVGLKAHEAEQQTNQEVNFTQIAGNSYDRLTIEGTLSLHNYTTQAATVEVTKYLTGEVTATTPAAEVVKLPGVRYEYWSWVGNPYSKITWKVPVEPGKDAEVKYTFRVVFRR
jgi:hypothetical protein